MTDNPENVSLASVVTPTEPAENALNDMLLDVEEIIPPATGQTIISDEALMREAAEIGVLSAKPRTEMPTIMASDAAESPGDKYASVQRRETSLRTMLLHVCPSPYHPVPLASANSLVAPANTHYDYLPSTCLHEMGTPQGVTPLSFTLWRKIIQSQSTVDIPSEPRLLSSAITSPSSLVSLPIRGDSVAATTNSEQTMEPAHSHSTNSMTVGPETSQPSFLTTTLAWQYGKNIVTQEAIIDIFLHHAYSSLDFILLRSMHPPGLVPSHSSRNLSTNTLSEFQDTIPPPLTELWTPSTDPKWEANLDGMLPLLFSLSPTLSQAFAPFKLHGPLPIQQLLQGIQPTFSLLVDRISLNKIHLGQDGMIVMKEKGSRSLASLRLW